MTHAAAGSRRRLPRAWLLPLLILVGVLAATYLGVFSRSIAVDFVAWWPVWLLLLALAWAVRGRRIGRVRISGLIPLMALIALGFFLAGHLMGWLAMPSASGRLVGPEVGATTTAALSAHLDGELRVHSGGTGFLYAVEPVRQGGEIGLPAAVEQEQGSNISVRLEAKDDPGWYTFAGWDLELDPGPAWSLALGGILEADLTGLRLSGLQLSGEGRVRLGQPSPGVAVAVSGAFEVVVPSGVPVRVLGEATVPPGWAQTTDGWESPTPGDGWVISVDDAASLSVSEP